MKWFRNYKIIILKVLLFVVFVAVFIQQAF